MTALRRARRAQRVVALGFIVLFALVMVGEYVVFRRGLDALIELRLAGLALTLYFVESILILILLISLVSFVASGLWIFYRAGDTQFLRASPLPLGGLYVLRSAETFLLTSWALGVVGLPALLALGTAYHQSLDFYFDGALVLLLFAVLIAGTGMVVTTLAAAAFARLPTRLAVGVAASVLVVGFLAVVGGTVIPSTADFYVIFEPGIMNGKPASIKFIEAKFGHWPSHPFAAALYTGATGRKTGSMAASTLLWLMPVASLLAAVTLGRALYARTLPAITETFTVAAPRATHAGARTFPRRLRGPVGALIERDLLALARSPHELSRAGFIALLLALYTSFVFAAPLREAGARPEALGRLIIFNVTAAGYFLTAFGLRFVFPSLSLEGRAAWVFFSSPINVLRLVFAKLALAVSLLVVAVVPIALAGTVRIVHDADVVAAIAVLLLLLAATTATLLLSVGAAWPNFREPNPEALSTSGAGLLVTVACLVYVAFMGWLARSVVLASATGGSVAVRVGVATVASVVLGTTALTLMARRVRTLEAI